MRKILAVAMLAAVTALGGRAEDPKPEEKKDPFREFKIGECELGPIDERIKIEDFCFKEQDLAHYDMTAELNIKNVSGKPLERALLHIALFDADKKLIETDSAIVGKIDGLRPDPLQPKVALHLQLAFRSSAARGARYWQIAFVVGKGEK